MKVNFCTWVDSVGGISKSSRLLKKPQATVWSWYHYERYPRPEQLELINTMSQGLVDNDIFRRDYLSKKKLKRLSKKL